MQSEVRFFTSKDGLNYNQVVDDVSRVLDQVCNGHPAAAEELLPLVYDELRKLAVARLAREQPGQTLQATALVNEAYLRLVKARPTGSDNDRPMFDGRGHFFAAAGEAMRRILVERARQRRATKHGGDFDRIDFHEALLVSQEPEHDLLALDEALSKLEKVDPAAVRLVQLRYFAGLQRQEIADILRMSPRSIDRLWAFTKAWLLRELES